MTHKTYLEPLNMYEGIDVSIAKFFISRMQFNTEDDYKRLQTVLSNFNGQVQKYVKSKNS